MNLQRSATAQHAAAAKSSTGRNSSFLLSMKKRPTSSSSRLGSGQFKQLWQRLQFPLAGTILSRKMLFKRVMIFLFTQLKPPNLFTTPQCLMPAFLCLSHLCVFRSFFCASASCLLTSFPVFVSVACLSLDPLRFCHIQRAPSPISCLLSAAIIDSFFSSTQNVNKASQVLPAGLPTRHSCRSLGPMSERC